MIETSSDLLRSSSAIFGNLQQSLENIQKYLENVRKHLCGLRNNFGKSSEIFRKWSEIFRKSSKIEYYMPACGYEFYLLVFNSISHSFAALTREILSWTLKDKICIHVRVCNTLYIITIQCTCMCTVPLFFIAKAWKISSLPGMDILASGSHNESMFSPLPQWLYNIPV